jgi:hypothetical protein
MSRIVCSLVVPEVTTTVLPGRSRKDLIGEPSFTMSLVPETKIVGRKGDPLLPLEVVGRGAALQIGAPRRDGVDARSRTSPAAI